ncbi:hypothetical protein nbrc107697_26980 [Gordonia crocea]|uniref:Uncharacterized protein n=1 Tax=Gordonia crocea TaxID=589162 RepID=A0A7I9V099_9ACTN|nr:hypothetical protein nbrc107697_26410 [Gordonia crocea]GED98659.1 hypothetical protein nbrc107697_26980 [Gordonia crocea]
MRRFFVEWALDLVEWALDLVEWALDLVEWALDPVEWAPEPDAIKVVSGSTRFWVGCQTNPHRTSDLILPRGRGSSQSEPARNTGARLGN